MPPVFLLLWTDCVCLLVNLSTKLFLTRAFLMAYHTLNNEILSYYQLEWSQCYGIVSQISPDMLGEMLTMLKGNLFDSSICWIPENEFTDIEV